MYADTDDVKQKTFLCSVFFNYVKNASCEERREASGVFGTLLPLRIKLILLSLSEISKNSNKNTDFGPAM